MSFIRLESGSVENTHSEWSSNCLVSARLLQGVVTLGQSKFVHVWKIWGDMWKTFL